MAIAIRTPVADFTTTTGTVLTSGTLALPAGTAIGDLAIIVSNINAGAAITAAVAGLTGTTRLDTQVNSFNDGQLNSWTKALVSGDPAVSPSTTCSSSRSLVASMLVISGATYESNTAGTALSGVTTAVIPSVTPAEDGALLVAMLNIAVTANSTAVVITTPGGWTLQSSRKTTVTAATRNASVVFTKQLGAGTGGSATGTTNVTLSVSCQVLSSVIVAAPVAVASSLPELVMAPIRMRRG